MKFKLVGTVEEGFANFKISEGPLYHKTSGFEHVYTFLSCQEEKWIMKLLHK